MNLIDGNYLQQFVAPGLLTEFRNYNDAFIGVLPRAPQAAINTDGIRFNKLINNVGFLVNNTDEFTAKAMAGKKGIVVWDKFDTESTSVTDAEIRGLAYDKRSEIRVKHNESFKIGVRDYAIRKLAPNAATATMPILRTTGENDGTGRLRLTIADMIKFYGILETLNLNNANGWNMTLCDLHKQDLMFDRASTNNYRDGIVFDPATGEMKKFYKINLWENNEAPVYKADGTLKAAGAAAAAGDQKASIFFYAPNSVYHIESLKLLYKPENQDTKSADPTSEFRIQAYGLCDKVQEHGFGAIASGNN